MNLDSLKADNIQQRMVDYLHTDVKLYSVGFDCIDRNYKVMLGTCTDITGYPYSGKTLWLMEILYNLSDEHGMKHLLHLPDSGKPEEVIATLLQKRTGKTFDKRYQNIITEDEIHFNMDWINEHFKILSYKERPTPREFWEYSNTIDVQTASIDSWNYMKHNKSQGNTEYLADVLSFRNEYCEKIDKHFFTIIHPKNPTALDFDSEGKLKAPDVHNLMGGSEWNNNGKNIVAIHKQEKEGDEYEIYHRKIKPRMVGKTGMEIMNYNITKQKFFKVDGAGVQKYANHEEIKQAPIDAFGGLPKNDDITPF